MTIKLTAEQRAAMDSAGKHEPVVVLDEQTGREYVLFDRQAYDRWLAGEIDKALAEVDRGETEPWETESIKEAGRQELELLAE